MMDVEDGVASPAAAEASLREFASRFPRLVATLGPHIHERLAEIEVDVPPLDPGQQRFMDALTATTWAVDWLAGERAEQQPEEAKLLGEGEEYDSTYVPHLVLRPLIWLAEGRRAAGIAEAQRLLDEGLGVPLTQRWARRIVDRGGEDLR